MSTAEATAVCEQISRQTGIPMEELLGESRQRYIIEARDKVIFMLHRKGYSAAKIGRMMQRDHSSILHSLAKSRRG